MVCCYFFFFLNNRLFLKFPGKKCLGKKCPGEEMSREEMSGEEMSGEEMGRRRNVSGKKWVGEEMGRGRNVGEAMSGEEMAREELTIYRNKEKGKQKINKLQKKRQNYILWFLLLRDLRKIRKLNTKSNGDHVESIWKSDPIHQIQPNHVGTPPILKISLMITFLNLFSKIALAITIFYERMSFS
jgi:hypothetical protein